jgi:DNA-binding MarR family transcriptional regulator
MSPGSWRDDDYLSVWSAILRLHAELVPAIDVELRQRAGISLAWYDVLLELSAAPERRMRMSDLGDAVVLSRTRVSRIVDELAADGHVTRDPNLEDRRSAFAALTAEGYKAFRMAAPIYLELIRDELGVRLSGSEAKQLRRLLEKALA